MKKYIILLTLSYVPTNIHGAHKCNPPSTIITRKNLQKLHSACSDDSDPVTPASFNSAKQTRFSTRSKNSTVLSETIAKLNQQIEDLEEQLEEKDKSLIHAKKTLNKKIKELARSNENHRKEIDSIDQQIENFNSANKWNSLTYFTSGWLLGAITSTMTVLYLWQPNKAHS